MGDVDLLEPGLDHKWHLVKLCMVYNIIIDKK